jgi:replicative DNA helicase
MAKKESKNLGFLGYGFQVKLAKQVVEDVKFSEGIIDILDPQYFDNEYLRLLIASVKDYHEKYETIPIYDTIKQLVNKDIKREIARESAMAMIEEIQNTDNKDCFHIQDTAIQFCKQQELKKATQKIQKIMESGDFDRYDECEEIMKDALSVGTEADSGIDVFHAVEDVLSDDFRKPIPTGLVGLDNLMDGGLSKGELGVILAPFGVGKTTLVTRMANTAYNLGYNVVQIFFEDNPKVIQRKHYTCWSEISLNELTERKDEVRTAIAKFQDRQKGSLILKKMPSDGTTIPHIKQYLRKLTSLGNKPDILFLDYIDCVESTKQYKDEYSGEGPIMRQFETMISELDIAGWTAIQGNRSSIGANVVEADMIGGSIKKGQIGHFIMSVAKTLEQKEEGRATMAILKSRFGKDGIIFEDIVFDNGTLVIDTEDTSDVSFLQFEKGEDQKRSNLVVDALNKRDARMAKKNKQG